MQAFLSLFLLTLVSDRPVVTNISIVIELLTSDEVNGGVTSCVILQFCPRG